jgi:hypothetical protein
MFCLFLTRYFNTSFFISSFSFISSLVDFPFLLFSFFFFYLFGKFRLHIRLSRIFRYPRRLNQCNMLLLTLCIGYTRLTSLTLEKFLNALQDNFIIKNN